jgi:hypothetical protein
MEDASGRLLPAACYRPPAGNARRTLGLWVSLRHGNSPALADCR